MTTQQTPSPLFLEIRETLSLSIPLSIAYGGNKLLGLVDTVIIGRLDATDIAGASIGNALLFLVMILGTGTLMGLDPLMSQAIGAGKTEQARSYLRDGKKLSLFLFVPITLLMFLLWKLILPFAGISTPVQASTFDYLAGRIPSILFFYLFLTSRSYLQSHQVTRPILIATIVANIANVPLSLILTLGDKGLSYLGLPNIGFAGWGVFGAAIGTSIVSFLQTSILWWSLSRIEKKQAKTEKPKKKPDIRKIISLGYPIALQMLAEGGLFVTVTLLMGRFGENQLGGHQVALQIASFSFTICLGLSSATSVRVGQSIGKKDITGARRAGIIGVLSAALFMSLSGLLIRSYAPELAHFFAKPKGVIQAGITFLGIAAVFQLFDGIQAVASGALRGMGKTKMSFFLNVISHWLVGMPTALLMAFVFGLGARGLWWGLTAGLVMGSITLGSAFLLMTRQEQPKAS